MAKQSENTNGKQTADRLPNGKFAPKNKIGNRFKEGKSGNPDGKPEGAKNVSTILKELLAQIAPTEILNAKFVKEFCKGKKTVTTADAVAARLLNEGLIKGEPWAVKEILDRTEGKAAQSLELTGKDGGAIQTESKTDLTKLSIDELIEFKKMLEKVNG